MNVAGTLAKVLGGILAKLLAGFLAEFLRTEQPLGPRPKQQTKHLLRNENTLHFKCLASDIERCLE